MTCILVDTINKSTSAQTSLFLASKASAEYSLPASTSLMSGGHFLKHLTCTLSSRSLSFTTLSRPLTHPFSSRFFTSRKPTELSRPNSPLTAANTSTSSSSETPSAQPFALPFQSVNIRCQRHVSVS